MFRSFTFIAATIILSGCELIPKPAINQPAEVVKRDCVFVTDKDQFSPSWHIESSAIECQISYWLDLWVTASATPWVDRKNLINQLGNTPEDELYKYVLSQPTDTPYQVRLRAQTTFNTIRPFLQESSLILFEQVAFKPSQQLLEYESAITILSQVNARHAKRNEEQAQLLLEQEEKINQLLNLEASILEKNSER